MDALYLEKNNINFLLYLFKHKWKFIRVFINKELGTIKMYSSYRIHKDGYSYYTSMIFKITRYKKKL